MFTKFESVNDEYKAKARSLASNLKSKTNPGLRESVVTGEVSTETLCTMSVEVSESLYNKKKFDDK
jgi:transcription elongation factor S-II